MVSRNPGEIWGKRGASTAKRDEQAKKETKARRSMASRVPQFAGKRSTWPKPQPKPQLLMPPSFRHHSVPHLAPRMNSSTEPPQTSSSVTQAGRQAASVQLHTQAETQAEGLCPPLNQSLPGHQLSDEAKESHETPQRHHLVSDGQLLSLVPRGPTQMVPSSSENSSTTLTESHTLFPPIAATSSFPQVSSADSTFQASHPLFNNSSLSSSNGSTFIPVHDFAVQQQALIVPPLSQPGLAVVPVFTVLPIVSLPLLQVNPVQLVIPQVQTQERLQLQQRVIRTREQLVDASLVAAPAANNFSGLTDNPPLVQATAAMHPTAQQVDTQLLSPTL